MKERREEEGGNESSEKCSIKKSTNTMGLGGEGMKERREEEGGNGASEERSIKKSINTMGWGGERRENES